MKYVRFAVVTILIMVFSLNAAASAEPEKTELNEVSLLVEEMFTPSCPALVKAAVENVEGVTSVEVTMENKTAVIQYNAAKAGPEDFKRAIKHDVGFTAAVLP